MKKIIKISIGVLLLLALAAGGTSAATTAKEPSYNTPSLSESADIVRSMSAPYGERRTMKVCSSVLSIYSNAELTGSVVSEKHKGDIVEATTNDGIVYEVFADTISIGYCHGSGLIYADTKTVAKLPVMWEIDSSTASKKYTELTDVNEFAYRSGSGLAVSEETILVQREVLIALSGVAPRLRSLGYTLSIESGYDTDEAYEDCPASPRSGALVCLALIDAYGNRVSVAENETALAAISSAGLLRHAESDLFYASEHEKYMQKVFSVSDYVYVIYE